MSLDAELRRLVAEEMARILAPLVAEVRTLSEEVRKVASVSERQPVGLISVEQAADLFQVEPVTIRSWIRQGLLTAYGTSRTLRISRAELMGLRPGAPVGKPDPNVLDLKEKILAKQKRR